MNSPRAELRKFLTRRFTGDGALRRFVRDNFEDLVPELSDENLLSEAETFIGGLTDRGLIRDLWPVLRAVRPKYHEEIAALEASWNAAMSGSPMIQRVFDGEDRSRLGRTQLKAVYQSARTAKLERSRTALLVGIPGNIVRALPSLPRPGAQLLTDLDRLNRFDGKPLPIQLWLENALLILTDGEDGSEFRKALDILTATEATKLEVGVEIDYEDAGNVLERIILPDMRPALLVRSGTFDVPDIPMWRWTLQDAKQHIEKAIAAIGRLEILGHSSLSWIGCAFAVNEDTICTAGHVARIAADKIDRHSGSSVDRVTLAWNPSRESDSESGNPIEVEAVILIHPVLDIALLRVPRLPDLGIEPLRFSTQPTTKGELLTRVSYVAPDPRVDPELQRRIFHDMLDGRKWVLPGGAQEIEQRADGKLMLAYDSTTLGGISGSPVISLETGNVVGIGVARIYLKANWAVPSWEILRDQRIRDAVRDIPADAPNLEDPWLDAWSKAEAALEADGLE